MNFQEFATEITHIEGKRESVNVAQVSEILSIISAKFRENPREVLEAFGYKSRGANTRVSGHGESVGYECFSIEGSNVGIEILYGY